MKKTLLSALAIAIVLGTSALAKAQETEAAEAKPVLVVSFGGYAELKRDLQYLGTVSGNPDMANSLEGLLSFFTQGQGLAGLDQDRPWGAAASLGDGGAAQPSTLVFLPVKDLQKLFSSLAALVEEPEDKGDGVWAIQKEAYTLYVKEKDGWAYVSQTAEGLDVLPKDPLKTLGGLEKAYDLALRLNIQNIPQALRDMGVDILKRQVETGLQQAADQAEDEEQFELQAQLARRQLETLSKAINELDEITLGWAIDSEGKRVVLDLNLTALEGSDTATQLASVANSTSKFAGFLLPEAMLTAHMNSVIDKSDIEQSLGMLDKLRGHVMEEIDEDEDLPDAAAKKLVKGLVGQVLDVAKATVKKGRINAGLAVVGEGPVTIAAGGLVADGAQLEKVARKLVELAQEEEGELEIKLDVAEQDGVKFHTVVLPLPDDEDGEKAKQLFGETLLVTLGFGSDSLYVSMGDEGIEAIKAVMAQSAEDAEKELPPMEIAVALAPLLQLASQQEDANPSTAIMAEMLKEEGMDHVKIRVQPIENGVQYEIEGEEGVIKLIGSAAKLATAAGGAGGF
ncbi:MAG TPA: hypothetical protein VHC19_06615 [Pirellulales bacterium]|nr:hypothetical protein [Pirellulales bacterium]